MDEKRLVERERALVADMAPDEEAKRIGPRLVEVGAEILHRADVGAEHELAEFDAFRLERAAELLRILDTEVFRLRTAIKCHRHGRMSNADLWKIAENWNPP